ncbi:MAG: metal ABC transporter ATP-binding protein [Deltaproteobacteria bacterium]|nr:metal ABC transporter ATP-binding protein [Deltaproteobacteria bacterium]
MTPPLTPAPAPAPLIRCDKLVVGHRGQALLPAIDVDVRRGALLAVVGRNGSGKTTWFRTVLGLLPPVRGRVLHPTGKPRAAYVPQSTAIDKILPLTALDLVLWGRLRGWAFLRPAASRADRIAAQRALVEAEAADLAHRSFRDLSDGQRQRVLFARLLVTDADLALLDEPTAAMDLVAERDAMARMHRLAHERNMAVIVVTHHLAMADQFADEVLFLDRDDQLVVSGTPRHVLEHPAFLNRYGQLEVPRAG